MEATLETNQKGKDKSVNRGDEDGGHRQGLVPGICRREPERMKQFIYFKSNILVSTFQGGWIAEIIHLAEL